MCLRRALSSIKPHIICKILLCFVCFISLRYLYRSSGVSRPNGRPINPILIWWTSKFPGSPSNIQYCKNNAVCEFTNIREKKFDKNTEGFLFYGSQFDYLDLPLPRDTHKYIWGLLHEESPRNTPIIEHEPTLQLFNYSSTISRYSNVPLTLQYLKSLQDLLTNNYFVQTLEKNALLNEIAPVLYIQTDCDTSSYRDSYVKELMKYISIDSYGSCLNNRKLPDEFGGDYLNNLDSDKFNKFVARYKFTISFENAVCEDYITEKLWRPLKVGSVPVYMGSPSVRDWLPNERSAIIANSFESPKQLAAYLEYLNIHDDKYESFLQHKISSKITNFNLIKSLHERKWKVNGYEMESFVSAFECFVCEMVYAKWQNKNFKSSSADQTHYNCPKPSPPPNTKEFDNWWGRLWTLHRNRASILHKLVIEENRKNVTFTDFSSSDSENDFVSL